MLFNVQFLNEIFPTNQQTKESEKFHIDHMMTDSRKQIDNSLFIPIVGEQFDGHNYLLQAIENGAVACFWEEKNPLPRDIPSSFPVFFVSDTTLALQQLASAYLQSVNPTVIGVTGSNGKTTTKDLLYALLSEKYRTHRTAGNFNNHIGLPLTILQMPLQTELVVLEMGMDSFGEIERLAQIAKPNMAIITNIGESHIENLGSREGIAKAKLEIISSFTEEDQLFIDGDEPLLDHINVRTTRCGFSSHNDLVITDIHVDGQTTSFTIEPFEERYIVPLIGKHHAKNATLAISVAKQLGLTKQQIDQGLKALDQTAMRFEFIEGKNNAQLINDAYNASPTSMKAAMDVLKSLEPYETKVAVLGDVLELGDFSESLHRSIAEVITSPIDVVYTYGKQAQFITKQLEENNSEVKHEHFATKELLIEALSPLLNEKTIILFKASRGMAFETLVEACSVNHVE